MGDATHTRLRDHLALLESKACVEPSAVQLLTVLIGKASEFFGSADSDPLWRMAVLVGSHIETMQALWQRGRHLPPPPPFVQCYACCASVGFVCAGPCESWPCGLNGGFEGKAGS